MSNGNSNETVEEIIAEMRDDRIIHIANADATRCMLRNLADRIEAAAARERDEDRRLAAIAESDEAFARCARCDRPERPGNAAALAAPARNCDRFATAKDAGRRPIRLLKQRLDALRVLETSFPCFAPNGEFVGRATHILLTYTPRKIPFPRECDQLTIKQIQELVDLCYEVLEIARKEKSHA